MRNLINSEIVEVSGGLEILDDLGSAIGKGLADFVNDAEYVYNAVKTRVLIMQALPG